MSNPKDLSNYDFNDNISKALEIFQNSDKIIITTHINPDGDAIGSALGLYWYGKQLGKEIKVINYSPVPANYQFLTGTDDIEQFEKSKHYDEFLSADAIFVVDLNGPQRLKDVGDLVVEAKCRKVLIDHHLEPQVFADYYIVDTDATSAAELVYKFIKQDGNLKLTNEIAEPLYVAIETDTGSFNYPRTDAEIHRIVAELIEAGAKPEVLYDKVHNVKELPGMRLLGEALANLELYFDGRLGIMSLAPDAFKRTDAIREDVEDIVENSYMLKSVEVGILVSLSPGDDEVRISFRSKSDKSVRDVAMKFGGGGHYHAAGARVKGKSVPAVKDDIIKEFESVFK